MAAAASESMGGREQYGKIKVWKNKEVRIPTLGSTPANRRHPWQSPPDNET